MTEAEIFNTPRGRLVRYWNFSSFIVSELTQVNPDNSLAECVNLQIYLEEKNGGAKS